VRVAVESGQPFTPGVPETLFDGPYRAGTTGPHFDVGPDGRFIMIRLGGASANELVVVQNWVELMERRTRN
jgi:hypothetical protein